MGLLDSVLGQVMNPGGEQPRGANDSNLGELDASGALGGPGAPGGLGGMLGGLGNLGPIAGALGGLLGHNEAEGGQGGLGGLIAKFQQAGMGDQINSWVGQGENQPVSEGQVHQALGDDVISRIASKLGINAASLLPMLAAVLPGLIDKLTPHGRVPEPGSAEEPDLLASLSGLLQKG